MADTIAAISTAAGNGAVSIIRISGEDALAVADALFRAPTLKSLSDAEPYKMYLGKLDCAGIADRCLAVVFRAPKSYTGEDVAELQCHGGRRLAEAALTAAIDAGARLADKGEFTKRAFLSGKLSLADAEGVADMINAESRSQLNAAYRQMNGELSREVRSICADLEYIIAQLEASLDYPEEMEEEAVRDADGVFKDAEKRLETLISGYGKGRIIKNGLRVALTGRPNVGKSSLLNALLKCERAIVAEVAGTTRDTIEEKLEINGLTVILTDTAGLRESDDPVEKIGVERAKEAARSADVVLYLSEAGKPFCPSDITDRPVISVLTKSDLGVLDANEGKGIPVSAKTGEGLDVLSEKIAETAGKEDESAVLVTAARHYDALKRAAEDIAAADRAMRDGTECALIELREAYAELGKITGETADEKIIDAIFEKFCLGK